MNTLQKLLVTIEAGFVTRTCFGCGQIVSWRIHGNPGRSMCHQAYLEGLFPVSPWVTYMAVAWKERERWGSQSMS